MSRLRLVHSIFTDQGTFESIVAVIVLTKLLSSIKTSWPRFEMAHSYC